MKGLELCFFRHGIALDKDDPSVASDADRPLTAEGIKKTRAAAKGLDRLGIPFDKILTSPWTRAAQTAAVLSEVLLLPATQELAELAGNHTPPELVRALASNHGKRTLLVGHEPLMSATVRHLLGGDWSLDLKKSGACLVFVDALPPRRPATLLWLATSRQLRLMGKAKGKASEDNGE
jgi:phosphohistidine phosphatase